MIDIMGMVDTMNGVIVIEEVITSFLMEDTKEKPLQ
jgi:hypothetical protein